LDQYKNESRQLVSDLDKNGREVVERLEGQTSELVERNEQLQQEIEDLFGQAADGGLFKQFDDLAEQCSPEREKWLKLLIVSAAGGGAGLALITTILAAFSGVAAIAVLLAGLTPLAFFLYFCTTQYNTERRAETQNQYRAALSRSMTAYRKLLASMKAEGIADSPFVDRMLWTLFNQPSEQSQPLQLADTGTTEPPKSAETIEEPAEQSA